MTANDEESTTDQDEEDENATLWQTLKALPRPFWMLFLGTFVNRFGTFVLSFLAIYLKSRNYAPGYVEGSFLCYGFGSLSAMAVGGYLADRIGRRNTMAVSMFAAGVCTALLALANTPVLILLFSGLVGFTAAMYHPAASALVADLVPPQRRVYAFAVLRFAINAGWAFGSAAGGFLAEHSFLLLFFGDAVTSAIFGGVILWTLPHGIRSARDEIRWSRALQRMKSDRAFVTMVLAWFGAAFIFVQMNTSWGIQITSSGFSSSTFGWLLSLNGMLIILLELPITRFVRRFEPRRVIAFGFLLLGIGFGLNALGANIRVFVAAMTVFTIGEMISLPVASAYISTLAPPHMRGRYMGVFGLSWSMAMFVGPAAGVRMFHIEPVLLWSMCLFAGVLSAGIAFFTRNVKSLPVPSQPAPFADS